LEYLIFIAQTNAGSTITLSIAVFLLSVVG